MKRVLYILLVISIIFSSVVLLGFDNNGNDIVPSYDDSITVGLFEDIIPNGSLIDKIFDNEKVVSSEDDRYVYLGGIPLGIDVKANGLIITGKQDVVTEQGVVSPFGNIDIKNGDILLSIDNNRVFSLSDVKNALKNKDVVDIDINRNGDIHKYSIKLAKDVVNGDNRLGIWLKDGIQGIGTLTYIDADSRRYGALGHPIEENKVYRCGSLYKANINGYIKGEKGKAGELDGTILADDLIGNIESNTNYGIFGRYLGKTSNFDRIKVANRNEVTPGKAYIYTTIDGNTPKYYEIEIIKKSTQLRPQTKGMVIRIVDEELLSKTNGILQGMSGSPIIQNNKLIGAVTHVFVNDPTKGYGVFIDFMLDR